MTITIQNLNEKYKQGQLELYMKNIMLTWKIMAKL